jgi:glycopeptide antibiotics resistance protein
MFVAVLAFMLLNPSALVPSWLVLGTADLLVGLGVSPKAAGALPIEFVFNMLGVVPVVLIASWLWPRHPWHFWTAWGFLGSVAVETLQGVAFSGRTASFEDIVANTLGALIGAVAFRLLAGVLPPLDPRPSTPNDPST